MRLINVYDYAESERIGNLWSLLVERTPEQSISHKKMPQWGEHVSFVHSRPYLAWYFIAINEWTVGSIYLSMDREVGISILKSHQGQGIGTEALEELIKLHGGPLLANINPVNQPSIDFFKKHGFEHIQNTYRMEEEDATSS